MKARSEVRLKRIIRYDISMLARRLFFPGGAAAMAASQSLHAQDSNVADITSFIGLEPHQFAAVSQIPRNDELYCEVPVGSLRLRFVSRLSAGESLIVFLPAAFVSGGERRFPHFARWTWPRGLGLPSIVVEDPTLYFGNLEGGWLQGTRDEFAIDAVVELTKQTLDHIGVSADRTIFYGSSIGGFAALQLAARLPGSLAIAEIPQTNLLTYPFAKHIRTLAQVVYGANDLVALNQEFSDRFSVIEAFRKLGYIPRIHLIHEKSDKLPAQTQIFSFMSELGRLATEMDLTSQEIVFETLSNGTGHKALPFEKAARRIMHYAAKDL